MARPAGELGLCGCPWLPRVAHVSLHHWEEPCLSGSRGSGTVFFGGCNLSCVFCQNHAISARPVGKACTPVELAEVFLGQQRIRAHNVNLVSPTQYSGPIADALRLARSRGLSVPVVYNSNGYETVEALARLEGLVDVFLPDLKYHDDRLARRYSGAPGYFTAATAAVKEMYRQVGEPVFDTDGLMVRGVLVRHLVLPGRTTDSRAVLRWLARELPGVRLSLMAQYTPVYRAQDYPELRRRVDPAEYEGLLDLCDELGLDQGYRQEPGAATEAYIPPFDTGVPSETEGTSDAGTPSGTMGPSDTGALSDTGAPTGLGSKGEKG